MFLVRSVCLSVCLSVCPSDYSQTCERILTKFFGGVGHGSRTKWYNFGGDPDHASDPGVQSPKSGSSGSAEVCALWAYLVVCWILLMTYIMFFLCFCSSIVWIWKVGDQQLPEVPWYVFLIDPVCFEMYIEFTFRQVDQTHLSLLKFILCYSFFQFIGTYLVERFVGFLFLQLYYAKFTLGLFLNLDLLVSALL